MAALVPPVMRSPLQARVSKGAASGWAGPTMSAPIAPAMSAIFFVSYFDIFGSLSRRSKFMRISGWP